MIISIIDRITIAYHTIVHTLICENRKEKICIWHTVKSVISYVNKGLMEMVQNIHSKHKIGKSESAKPVIIHDRQLHNNRRFPIVQVIRIPGHKCRNTVKTWAAKHVKHGRENNEKARICWICGMNRNPDLKTWDRQRRTNDGNFRNRNRNRRRIILYIILPIACIHYHLSYTDVW